MKLLLIYPPRREDSYVFPPTSLLYVAQAARAAGHEAEIIDIPYLLEKHGDKFSLLDGSLCEYIIRKECDVLGLGGVVSTYFFYDYFVKRFREAKKNIPIVVGGSVGVPIRDVWEKHAPVDYMVEADGETVIQKLLDGLEKRDYGAIERIPGLHYLKNGRYQSNPPELADSLDRIPFLNYDEIDHEYYIDELTRWIEDIIPRRSLIQEKKLKFLPLLTSRGCPFGCTFCFHFSKKHYMHSVEYVVENIKFLKRKYGINGLYIIDDLFIFNRKRTIQLCESIYKADLGVYFIGGGGKPSFVNAEMLEAMKKAGFIRFSYGIESGSQKMLDIMQKQTSVEQNLKALNLTDEKGIPAIANIVLGMPGENCRTLEETKDLLISAGLNTKQFYASWAVAYPGAPLFDWMKKKDMVRDTREYLFEVGSIGKYVYNFSELPLEQLKRKAFLLHQEVDMAYYLKFKKYGLYLKKLARRVLGEVFYRLNPKVREGISAAVKMVLPRREKRSIKRSNAEVDEWISRVIKK